MLMPSKLKDKQPSAFKLVVTSACNVQTFPQRLVNLGGFLANMLVWTQVIQPAADKSYW